MRARFLVAAAAAALPAALAAQPGADADTLRVVLEPMVVVAERERSAPPPVATTRVSAEAVHRAQAENPYDLARRVAGIEVHDPGQGPGFAANTVVRGFTSDHSGDVLLVVDGVPVNLPIHGHGEGYADWSALLPAAVSSFRVIHGAASPLYGDFALGGVVEVFTAADAAGTSAGAASSSHGDVGAWAMGGRRGAGGGSLAAVDVRRNEGWRSNSGYALLNGLLRGWRAAGAGRLEGGLSLYGSEWSSPGFLTLADYNDHRLRGATDASDGGDTRRAVAHGRWATPLGPGASAQATAWGMLSEWTLFLNIPVDGEPLSQTGERDARRGAGGQAEVVWTPAAGEITLGVSGRADGASYTLDRTAERRRTARETEVDATHRAGALYARLRRTLGGRLGVDLGARVDVVRHATLDLRAAEPAWSSHARVVASPKLGARYRVSDALSLRASTSRGFRSPPGVVLDPARAPMLAWSHEAGADLHAGRLEGSVALFRTAVDNERVLDPVTREISSAGSSVRQGVDVDVRARLRAGVHATAAATWNDARLVGEYADAHEEHAASRAGAAPAFALLPAGGPRFHEGHDHAVESQRIPGVARYTGSLGLEAELAGGALAGAAWRFTGPYVPIGEPQVRSRAFSVLDVGGSVPLGRRVVLDLALQNALGLRYAEMRASGFVTPGAPRTLRASLRFAPGTILDR